MMYIKSMGLRPEVDILEAAICTLAIIGLTRGLQQGLLGYSNILGGPMGFLIRMVVFIFFAGLTMVPAFVGCDDTKNEDNSLMMMMALMPGNVYVYSAGTHDGYLIDRANADSICATAASAFPAVADKKVKKAFISFSGTDQIKDVVDAKHADSPVYGVKADGTETLLKDSWSNLWTSSGINDTLENATGITANWWTGSMGDGTYPNAANSCLAWTCNADPCVPAATGKAGQHNNLTTLNWVTDVAWACNASRFLLCVAY